MNCRTGAGTNACIYGKQRDTAMKMLLRRTAAVRTLTGLLMLAAGGLMMRTISEGLRASVQCEPRSTGGKSMRMLSGRDMLSEQLSFFMLGGLSSLAAEVLVLDAATAWMEQDWPRVLHRWQMITTLNPHRLNYWINASNDMAVNAASHALNDSTLSAREQVRQSRDYFGKGEAFLRKGIAHRPDAALLYMHLGDMYADLNRFPDFEAATDAYRRAVQLGATPLYERLVFYNLCRIRGREEEALRLGRKLFDDPAQRVPSLRCLLFVMQRKSAVQPAEQLSLRQLFGSEERARRDLRRFLHNKLRFPVTGISDFLQGGN